MSGALLVTDLQVTARCTTSSRKPEAELEISEDSRCSAHESDRQASLKVIGVDCADYWWILAIAALALTGACVRAQADVAELKTVDGVPLGGDLATDESQVVIFADPDDCLSCDQDLLTMLKLRRAYPGRIRLILTRPPSPSERKQLALAGQSADEILRAGEAPRLAVDLPAFAVLRRGGKSPVEPLVGAIPKLRELLRSSDPEVVPTP